MRTFWGGVGMASAAMLVLAACGSSTLPTASGGATSATATGTTAATNATPVVVSGYVTDAATGQPLGNVNIECMGNDVQCRGLGDVTAQDTDHAVVTNANGYYTLLATDLSAKGDGQFLMNANALKYMAQIQSVRFSDRVCSSGQPDCTLSSVNFSLAVQPDPTTSSRRAH